MPNFDRVLEDVPGAGGGDVLCDGGVVPHHKEAQLVLVHTILVAVLVIRLFRLKIDTGITAHNDNFYSDTLYSNLVSVTLFLDFQNCLCYSKQVWV